MSHLKILGLPIALVAAVTVAAVPIGALDAAHSAANHAVTLKGVRFQPSTLNIKRGESVTWAWNIRNSEHNVTFSRLHSKTGSKGSFSVRFTRSGTFSYLCTIHVRQGMRGKIVVH
jgi:plastocyanin